ncbi:MAG: ABC transporter permease [Firmicutes bacterium]|nr:ABC transporter permease [Bacillota bacterium]
MRKRSLGESQGFMSFLSSFIAIVLGLVFGFLFLLIINPGNALTGMGQMLSTGFGSLAKFGKVLYQAAPLIMTGLSVAFAFKTGLFNIGATGQYTVGGVVAIICVVVFRMPWWAGMLAGMLGGAIWGIFPGLFKALFNVNEVITCIMFNYIAMFTANVVVANIPKVLATSWGDVSADRTANLAKVVTAKGGNPQAIIPTLGLDKLFGSNFMNISIFIAILFAVIIFIVLHRTTFGYELKACGANKNASIYAGISAKRNIVLSMVIAGGLSGIAGGMTYLAGTVQYVMLKDLLAMGYNGIPVALLGVSHPIATVFSALFISYIQVGGDAMQPTFSTENINIIIAVIIYLAAFALLLRVFLNKIFLRREEAAQEHDSADADPGNAPPMIEDPQSADAVLKPAAETGRPLVHDEWPVGKDGESGVDEE